MDTLASGMEFIKSYYVWFLVLSVAVFVVLERWHTAILWPAAPGGGQLRRWTTGVVFGVLNHASISSLLALPFLVWCTNFHWWNWPSNVPMWFLIALTFVARDLASYWFHRLGHAYEFFWRFHQIHHLDEFMDVSTELRVHVVERLLQTAITVLLVMALSLPASGIVLHGMVGFLTSLFHHANLKLPAWLERLLSPVLVTPAFHAPHHHELRRDTNSNYGFIFPWWDRLFGTYNARKQTPGWRMGLDYSPDLGCIELLCEPFRLTPLWERQRNSGKNPHPSDVNKTRRAAMNLSEALPMRIDDELVALWRYEDDGCPNHGGSVPETTPSSDGSLARQPFPRSQAERTNVEPR